MHWCVSSRRWPGVVEGECTGSSRYKTALGCSFGDTMHGAILIGLGICVVPIGRLNAPERQVIETNWCTVSNKCINFSNSYWYFCGAYRSYKFPGA